MDNTTDVRGGKLTLYESWGFPEVWVEVPEQSSPSRPAGLRPSLTIYLLEGGAFRTAAPSQSFAGWTAHEVHRALNEPELSRATLATLRRVRRALGAAGAPEDRRTARNCAQHAAKIAQRATPWVAPKTGWKAGSRCSGKLCCRCCGPAACRSQRRVPATWRSCMVVSTAALVQAALACRDEADFL